MPDDKSLVFVVGFPRSGTTLLESRLASHPAISTSGEAPLLATAIRSLLPDGASVGSLIQILASASQSDLDAARGSYYQRLRSEYGDDFEFFVDKLPLNIIELVLIRALFPDAPVVLCLRDPRDVCLSCFFQWFTLSDAMKPFLNWETTINYYAGIMDYWRCLEPQLSGAVYINRYEDLVAEPTKQLRSLARHMRLPWDNALLGSDSDSSEEKSQQYFHTPSNEAVRSQVYSSAIARWRHYPEPMARAEPVLRTLAEQLGYSW